jgi:phage/plasmid-associated DNA primase
MFQVPGERGHTVLLLKSGQGAGKNIIVDMLVQAFGEHATIAVKPNDLVGQFNDSLGTSVLVFANEAVWGGDKTLEGALKTLVTDEEIVIEKKYIPKYRVTNCVHLIMASNNDWAAPIDMDDRRFVVLDLDESRKKDLEYFKTLRAEIKHGGREAFVHELLTLDIAGFDPRDRPTIEGHQATRFEAVLRGADSVTQWWIACLSRGEVAIVVEAEFGTMKTKTRKILTDGWEQGPIEIPTGQVFEAYQAWCQTGRHRVAHETTFGKKLAEMSTATKTRPRLGDKRVCCYAFENLAVCRATYDQILGFEGPWINDSSVDDSLSK